MPNTVTYQQLLHDIGLRANALIGTQSPDLQTTYATAILTAANFDSADFPFGAIVDSMLMAEENFARTIAQVGDHPDRSYLASATASLANGVPIPSVDAGGKPRIGILGNIKDALTGNPMLPLDMDSITRFLRNADGRYQCPVYGFQIRGNIIYHTVANVVIDCCVYSQAAQLTIVNANGVMLLPDTYRPALASEALGMLTRDGVYESQAAIYKSYATMVLADIKAGLSSVTGVSAPSPALGAAG